MTLNIDVNDGAARWQELIAEVEVGRDVVIARGGEPVARVKKELDRPDRETVEAGIAAIMNIRQGIAPTTVEEILAWRNEGRR